MPHDKKQKREHDHHDASSSSSSSSISSSSSGVPLHQSTRSTASTGADTKSNDKLPVCSTSTLAPAVSQTHPSPPTIVATATPPLPLCATACEATLTPPLPPCATACGTTPTAATTTTVTTAPTSATDISGNASSWDAMMSDLMSRCQNQQMTFGEMGAAAQTLRSFFDAQMKKHLAYFTAQFDAEKATIAANQAATDEKVRALEERYDKEKAEMDQRMDDIEARQTSVMMNVVNCITAVEDKVAALYGVLQTQEGLVEGAGAAGAAGGGGGGQVDMAYLRHLEGMLEEVLGLQSLAKAWKR